ncbi:hypothetical protein EG865_15505, partial [Enterococcus faecalis]
PPNSLSPDEAEPVSRPLPPARGTAEGRHEPEDGATRTTFIFFTLGRVSWGGRGDREREVEGGWVGDKSIQGVAVRLLPSGSGRVRARGSGPVLPPRRRFPVRVRSPVPGPTAVPLVSPTGWGRP